MAIATANGKHAAPLAQVHALVVDYNRDSLDLTCLMLEEAGASTLGVRSARAALLVAHSFDVVVSDIVIPEMDGYALVQQIRASRLAARIPAVALSAVAYEEGAARAFASGYQRYITKPVFGAQLIAAVAQAVRLAHVKRLMADAREWTTAPLHQPRS